ncbi:hypothetical protein JYT84_00280 [bacterium AH-315-M10]|nr:hypothetical protein [bacterium AH-315-M10]
MKRGLPPLHIRNTAVERSEALLAQLRVAILGGKGDSASEILHLLWKLLGESPSLLPGLLAEYSSSGSAPFRETLIWVFSSTRDDRVMKLLGDEFLNKVNSQKLRETALELLQTQVGGLRAEAMRTHGAIESSLKKAATDVRESAAIRSTALSLIGKFSHGTDELRDLVRLVLSSEHDPSVLSSALLVATQWQESEEFMQDSLRVLHMRGAVDDDLVESAVTYLALSRLPAAGAALLKELEYNPRGAIRAAIATDLGARSEDPVVQTADSYNSSQR